MPDITMPRSAISRSLVAAAAGLAFVAFLPETAVAVPADPAPPAPKRCAQHKQGSSAWKRCMGQRKKLKDDVDVYAAGYWLAKAGEHAAALDVLRSASNQADPRIQTMIGFSLRMLGHVDEAMAYYAAALAANPDLTSTRQYLGEAYLQKGDRIAALGQLGEIERRCGKTCEDYRLLATAIERS